MLEHLSISCYNDKIKRNVYNFSSREKTMSADNQQERLELIYIKIYK